MAMTLRDGKQEDDGARGEEETRTLQEGVQEGRRGQHGLCGPILLHRMDGEGGQEAERD